MWVCLRTISTFLTLGAVSVFAVPRDIENELAESDYTAVCKTIQSAVSNSTGVYYFLHPLYIKGNSHWASSSSQNSACVVEPGNRNDISTILKIIANTSTPFGVRSGGHATNPGFSSTPGVQIALFKFSEVTYHPAPAVADGSVGTVDIGAGLVWDSVYAALEPHGVNVVGGRVTGVGVGGFTLGGGYSWLSNQYGLTIDTVTAFELVLPNGTLTTATETKNPDLFFGLKGGFNNFGIVTKFTLLAFPQGQVWGGLQTFTASNLDKVNKATADFVANVTDPKAGIITTYNFLLGQPGVSLLMFYDGPTPPAGLFDRFTSIPHFTSDVSTRSFLSLVGVSPSDATYGFRFGFFISYDVEPFLPSMTKRSKGGAYPHDDFLAPLNLYYAWVGEEHDEWYQEALEESTRSIREQAIAEGQDIGGSKQIKYGNYASATEDLTSQVSFLMHCIMSDIQLPWIAYMALIWKD
ncbi:FAD-binding domain protein [Rhizoctonia solani]|uniref:FAD-binding domain protein n=1 Tax=Rhizoctonia solani TaxID=456999 RepID=A0A8H8T180_9AGAM|nr:FAD-binding domain protein [Rhizoctonia solani]QRW25529.1 FAD-binding domain protein [Rhizoctonia solani]